MLKSKRTENLHYKLFAIATPIIVQNLVHYFQIQVDMAMLGRYDTQSFGTIFVITVSAIVLFVLHMDLKGILITMLFDESIRAYLIFRRFRSYEG
jgi:Na+-driven multidrug efflux pump